tara:strand:+ start:204 stop:389 length:186 start_codon:yes stop_codon:yes gene_type:complete
MPSASAAAIAGAVRGGILLAMLRCVVVMPRVSSRAPHLNTAAQRPARAITQAREASTWCGA